MNQLLKIDLHTHSTASPDGGLTASQYAQALERGLLDYVAVTDHNSLDFALELQHQLGDKIIVGEEIMTTSGEIIGLFLSELVPAGLSPTEAVKRVRDQAGLVYIPHPFETVRKGLHPAELETIQDQVDIIEVCNGRAFAQNRASQALVWAKLNQVAGAASSDAHGYKGLGKTYTMIHKIPDRESLVDLIKTGTPMTDRPGLRSLLYPKYHRLRKRLRKGSA